MATRKRATQPEDVEYFHRVAENFMHPLIMRHDVPRSAILSLEGLLERTAMRAREGRIDFALLPPGTRRG